jgi:hypothetical protein
VGGPGRGFRGQLEEDEVVKQAALLGVQGVVVRAEGLRMKILVRLAISTCSDAIQALFRAHCTDSWRYTQIDDLLIVDVDARG